MTEPTEGQPTLAEPKKTSRPRKPAAPRAAAKPRRTHAAAASEELPLADGAAEKSTATPEPIASESARAPASSLWQAAPDAPPAAPSAPAEPLRRERSPQPSRG